MELPIITSFINGLKLFFENKRLRWLTLVFLIGLLVTGISGSVGLWVSEQNPLMLPFVVFVVIIVGGIWPVFFLLTAVFALLGLQRFIASEESYLKSFGMFLPWLGISVIVLFIFATMFLSVFSTLIFIVAFVGWIAFQSYFSTRTALKYGGAIDTTTIGRERTVLAVVSNIFSYVVIVGALLFVLTTNLVELLGSLGRLALLIIGTGMALLFNFLNGLIMARHRNKATLGNIALIGMFVSLYSAYFIYNAGKPVDIRPDLVSIAISLFFVFYTMSSVGSMLASRAHLDTMWKLSPEAAATLTFFLASGYYFADILFPIILPDPTLGASISDLIKLLLFPFIALIMELLYLRKVSKVIEAPPPEAVPPEKEPTEKPIEEEPVEEVRPEEIQTISKYGESEENMEAGEGILPESDSGLEQAEEELPDEETTDDVEVQ